jgi:hypothetical protein
MTEHGSSDKHNSSGKRHTRRRFLCDAGGLAASVAMSGLLPAGARSARRRGRKVAIFGGGVAGLTAAHELAVRGFDVTVYERRAWGGKARSTDVPGSASGGRKPLPGEHGFRVWFGFYQNTSTRSDASLTAQTRTACSTTSSPAM